MRIYIRTSTSTDIRNAYTKSSQLLTTIDESVLRFKAAVLLVLVGVESDDEDAVHGDEEAGQLSDVVAAVATV